MIRLFFILITLFAVERVVSKRINTYKIKKVKTLIHQINNQYKYLFKGKSEYINFYQWLILFISQAFVVYALVRYIVKKIFRYVEENYINKILEKKLEIEESQDISSTNEITFELN